MNKLFLFSTLVFILIVSTLNPAILSNRYLLVDVDDDTGRVFLSTLEGRDDVKGDEKKNLLFYDSPPASYSVIYVNDDLFIFGGERGEFSKWPVTVGNSIDAVWENELIRVTQTVEFVQRENSGVEDGILITYSVKNLSETEIKVGLRQLFDTYLGEQHGKYHFSLADGEALEYEAAFEGNEIPLYWISMDRVDNPTVCLKGILSAKLITTPRKVVFANYKTLREQLLDYRVRRKKRFHNLPYSKNDSAVALYYEKIELISGETGEFKTILGLCGEGEYIVEAEEIVEVGEEIVIIEEQPLPETRQISREEAEKIAEALNRYRTTKASVEKLNEVIDKLNAALAGEDKSLTEEELMMIRNILGELEEREK